MVKNPVIGSMLFIFTCISLLIGAQLYRVENYVESLFPTSVSNDYFYALIVKEESISWVSRKMTNLPGVKNCQKISEEKISSQLKSILSEISDNFDIDIKYAGLKIYYKAGIEERSQNLIREYLIRLVGREKVTLGPIKKIEKPDESSTNLAKEYIGYVLLAGCCLIWLVCFIVFRKYLVEQTYLISRYQQRKNVLLKTIMGGVIGMSIVVLGVQLLIGSIHIYGSIGVVAFFIVSALLGGKGEKWVG